MKVIAQNKKAFHDYDIQDRLEVGIVLRGDEVKSIRAGHVNLTGSFGHVKDGELFLVNCHITPYSHAYDKADDSSRTRKLLLHRRELERLIGEISRKGVILVPLKLYLNNKGRVKIDLGVCKHKKAHERKEEIRERDIQRETRRELKDSYRY
jgi:SsrA-binding protein